MSEIWKIFWFSSTIVAEKDAPLCFLGQGSQETKDEISELLDELCLISSETKVISMEEMGKSQPKKNPHFKKFNYF